MEEIFYAALALHVVGKPVNKENIQAVLARAGITVDESALQAVAAFVKSLGTAHKQKEQALDPRIIRLLTSELAQREVQKKRLQGLLVELATGGPLPSHGCEGRSHGMGAAVRQTEACFGPVGRDDRINRGNAEAVSEVPRQDVDGDSQFTGRYVYGVAKGNKKVMLGPIGLDGRHVYTVPYQDIIAIVHDCLSHPYQSSDHGVAEGWVRSHQMVLDAAKEQFGTIIPMAFDTILLPKDGLTAPERVVENWLKEEYERLHTVIESVEGKDEYVVQVSYELNVIARQISEESEEVRRLQGEVAAKAPGAAYLYRQKLERALRSETDRLADRWFKEFFERIKSHTDDIVVERTKRLENDKVMFLNLSCLVARDKVASLGEELERIDREEGFSVHFSGPWPPYSFVAKPVVSTQGK